MRKMLRDGNGGSWKRKGESLCEERLGHDGSVCCHIAGGEDQ